MTFNNERSNYSVLGSTKQVSDRLVAGSMLIVNTIEKGH